MTSPPESSRTMLLVAGPGRSGTSLFTGIASRLGFHVPRPEVAANRTNPRGFSEPRWAVDFHERLLKATSVAIEDARPEAPEQAAAAKDRPRAREDLTAWLTDQFGTADRLIIKDPRLTWFADLYRDIGAELGVQRHTVTMVRHPAEVLKSRELAYGTKTGPVSRIAGWINVMLATEYRSRGDSRAYVGYPDLLSGWRDELSRVESVLGVPLLSAAAEDQVTEADDLVDPTLRRSVSSLDELGIPAAWADLAVRVLDRFERLCSPGADEAAERAALDDLREEYTDRYRVAEEIAQSTTRAAIRRERSRARRRLREAQDASRSADPVEQ